ncbi:MAG: BrnA antitoxin family protein [Steroidobacteraceae bacterium]
MRQHKLVSPSAAEDRRINAGIKADPDTHELSAAEIAGMKPWRPRGRPKAVTRKVHVNVRLDPDVVEFFRSAGHGWQTRLNAALLAYVKRSRTRQQPDHA